MAVQFNRQGLEDYLQSSQEGWQIQYTLYPHAAWTINTTAVREVPKKRKYAKKSNLGNPLFLHTFSRLLLSKSQKCKCFDWGERFWQTRPIVCFLFFCFGWKFPNHFYRSHRYVKGTRWKMFHFMSIHAVPSFRCALPPICLCLGDRTCDL